MNFSGIFPEIFRSIFDFPANENTELSAIIFRRLLFLKGNLESECWRNNAFRGNVLRQIS